MINYDPDWNKYLYFYSHNYKGLVYIFRGENYKQPYLELLKNVITI